MQKDQPLADKLVLIPILLTGIEAMLAAAGAWLSPVGAASP